MLDAAMDEDELLARVMRAAELKGWRAYHVRDSKRGIVQGPGCEGFPDIVLLGGGWPPRLLFVELKREKGRLSEDQSMWRYGLEAAGADWRLWRPSSWADIEATLEPIPALSG